MGCMSVVGGSQTKKRVWVPIVNLVAISNAQTKDRFKLKQMFREAYERCLTAPWMAFPSPSKTSLTPSINMTLTLMLLAPMLKALCSEQMPMAHLLHIAAKSTAYLPLQEACIHRVNHVEEAGTVAGLREEFLIIGENVEDDSLILSLRSVQYDLAWERCRQLQSDDVLVKDCWCKQRCGVVAEVEGLRGFVPYSQISTKSTGEELLNKELPLKFVEVDEEQSRLVLSNRKVVADSQAQLGIGSVVTGSVQSLKPYGAFIDIGGINGLLHVSQISHDRVIDIETVLQPGDTLKVMILSHDQERGRVSLSTKKLEPTPGDLIRNPKLVFEKAEEMAQTFRQRIAQAEAMAFADMPRFPA